MHILMTSLRYPPTIGGAEAAAATLAKGLAKRGHRVTVISGTDGEIEPSNVDGVSVRWICLPAGRGKGARYVAAVVRATRGVRPVDVVHAHMASGPAIAALALAQIWRVPAVVKPSSGGGQGNLAAVRTRWGGRLRIEVLRRRVAAWVAVTTGIAEELREIWNVPDDRISRIPNAVDLARFGGGRKIDAPTGRRFLYVGRLHRDKGVDVLLKAWSLAGQPGTLEIVGEGPEAESLRALAVPSVCFRGAVRDPAPLYRSADAFVLPSRREGLSNALIEAMASGLPVIATAVGGTPEALNGNGRLVHAGDVDALAEALSRPLPPRPDALQIEETYGANAIALRHEQLYERLLGPKT